MLWRSLIVTPLYLLSRCYSSFGGLGILQFGTLTCFGHGGCGRLLLLLSWLGGRFMQRRGALHVSAILCPSCLLRLKARRRCHPAATSMLVTAHPQGKLCLAQCCCHQLGSLLLLLMVLNRGAMVLSWRNVLSWLKGRRMSSAHLFTDCSTIHGF